MANLSEFVDVGAALVDELLAPDVQHRFVGPLESIGIIPSSSSSEARRNCIV